VPPHYSFEPVADGVLAAIHRPGGGGVGNAAIVDLGRTTLVFDTGMTPQAGAELRAAAEELAPVAVVVNSHFHADHVRGNQAFENVEIVATGRTQELIETRGAERLAEHQAMDADAYVDSLPDGPDRSTAEHMAQTIATLELRPPTRTFEDRVELAPGCELVTLGGGHTESDAFLVLRDRGVAVMGDLLTTRMHPWMGDGYPEQWIEILAAVEAMGLERFVPGHGEVASVQDVRGLREHLVAFLDDPHGIEARYPEWDFQGGTADRNRAVLAERAGV